MLALPVTSATLDGEGVVCDDRGVTDFDRLRSALAGRGGSRAPFLYAFDLLAIDGADLRRQLWEIRRATLTRLLRAGRSPSSVKRARARVGPVAAVASYALSVIDR
jgi:ATP-dependent DNA ligase